MFVNSLKYGYYRFQFSQFGWAHMLLLLVVSQAYVLIYNIYEGFIWCVRVCYLTWADIQSGVGFVCVTCTKELTGVHIFFVSVRWLLWLLMHHAYCSYRLSIGSVHMRAHP